MPLSGVAVEPRSSVAWAPIDGRRFVSAPLHSLQWFQLCVVLIVAGTGLASSAGIVELDDEGRHKGAHRSKDDGYVWPQVPPAS